MYCPILWHFHSPTTQSVIRSKLSGCQWLTCSSQSIYQSINQSVKSCLTSRTVLEVIVFVCLSGLSWLCVFSCFLSARLRMKREREQNKQVEMLMTERGNQKSLVSRRCFVFCLDSKACLYCVNWSLPGSACDLRLHAGAQLQEWMPCSQWLNCPATGGIPKFETTRLVSERFKNR